MDPATGKRRVTSLSKLRVPEEGLSGDMEDQRAAGIIEARMSGSEQLPRLLSVPHTGPAAAGRSHGRTASRTSARSMAGRLCRAPHGTTCAAGPPLLSRERLLK